MAQSRWFRSTAAALALLMSGVAPGSSIAAPLGATLTPANVKTNKAFNVTLSNPVFANGKLDVLALRADVNAGTSNNGRAVKRVVFVVTRNGARVFTHEEKGAPFCIFGDKEQDCNALQAGDDFPDGGLIKVGDYQVKVSVFSTSTTPDWEGSVKFVLNPGAVNTEKSPLGTGSGNGPNAQVIDRYYSASGMRAMRVEVRVFTDKNTPMNLKDVQYVRFRVTDLGRSGRDYGAVFANHETGAPYCIFGEEANGKTCKTLRVGDRWPPSNRLKENTGDLTEKENDPEISSSVIQPGDYEITIFISTNHGTWSSSAEITLLP